MLGVGLAVVGSGLVVGVGLAGGAGLVDVVLGFTDGVVLAIVGVVLAIVGVTTAVAELDGEAVELAGAGLPAALLEEPVGVGVGVSAWATTGHRTKVVTKPTDTTRDTNEMVIG